MKNSIEKLNEFKVGDVVNIHNVITNQVSYIGVIKHIADYAYIKDGKPCRFAVIMEKDIIHENTLSSAKKVI